MTAGTVRFVDQTAATEPDLDDRLWPALVVSREEIDAEIERLAALPAPANGRRRSLIVHPQATEPGLGLAPGIQVAVEVLLPGERTRPRRHNSSAVNFCIRGRGFTVVQGRKLVFEQHDVWLTPALESYVHENDSADIQVRLAYSNAALLEKLNVHFVDENPPEQPVVRPDRVETEQQPHPVADVFELEEGGPLLMSYERLINPDVIEQDALHWEWTKVKAELDKLQALGEEYRGRRLYLLYNPATGRTNGTTNSFFATMCVRPPGIVDRPHRHSSVAINYFFGGHGYSRVGGKKYDWKAGDLMLSAPGWAVHNHASGDEPVYELTIQDSPLNLAMDSLMWQEDLKQAPILLGSHRGWDTNRQDVAGAGLAP
jgi:gentisate 1,2-dioxygenase